MIAQISDPQKRIEGHYPINLSAGWNLVSLPATVADSFTAQVFPNAASRAFMYKNEYISIDTLTTGQGFWIKYNFAEILLVNGNKIPELTIPVYAGWNLIGSITTPFLVGTVISHPVGIIVSDFFEYWSGNYKSAESVFPGSGYWVKVDQDGFIVFSEMGEPCPNTPTVEYEGKIYSMVLIEEQCWLRENLDVGIRINGLENQTDNGEIEKYCYGDNLAMCDKYGGLYQWGELMKYITVEGTRGICPVGWHIPKKVEFQTLQNATSGDGNSLKAIGTGSGKGMNLTGFSAFLTGYRHYSGSFQDAGNVAYLWSSTDLSSSYSNSIYMNGSTNIIAVHNSTKESGYSVRCIKD